MKTYHLPFLPLKQELETKAVLKKTISARSALAELKGVHATVPNVGILLNTLSLQEAKDSSAIENIITTDDELFKAELDLRLARNVAAKEVQRYALALKEGFLFVSEHKIITHKLLLDMHKVLEQNDAGYRKLPGTELKNQQTQEVVYTPPQNATEIRALMDNLLDYLNDDGKDHLDPLIKLAVIHHQFESIHPFYDGNGRLGRIINILFLIAKDLLDVPSLYLSRFFIQYKPDYYRLLQQVRTDLNWEAWIIFVLTGIESVAVQSTSLIKAIKEAMLFYKHTIRNDFPRIYSQDLLNNLFKHPYTKIEFVQNELKISRQTASRYLAIIADHPAQLLKMVKLGRENYYINTGLMALFTQYDYQLEK